MSSAAFDRRMQAVRQRIKDRHYAEFAHMCKDLANISQAQADRMFWLLCRLGDLERQDQVPLDQWIERLPGEFARQLRERIIALAE
jgi:hypothetical protein